MKHKRPTETSPLVRLVGWQAGHETPATGTATPGNGHRLAPGIVSAAAVATGGRLGPAVLAAPGDLDPSFADVGRWSGLNLDGPCGRSMSRTTTPSCSRVAMTTAIAPATCPTLQAGCSPRLSCTTRRCRAMENSSASGPCAGPTVPTRPWRFDCCPVVRASGGGYRVMASLPGWKFSVSGLTETGALDPGFGNAGIAAAGAATNLAQLPSIDGPRQSCRPTWTGGKSPRGGHSTSACTCLGVVPSSEPSPHRRERFTVRSFGGHRSRRAFRPDCRRARDRAHSIVIPVGGSSR